MLTKSLPAVYVARSGLFRCQSNVYSIFTSLLLSTILSMHILSACCFSLIVIAGHAETRLVITSCLRLISSIALFDLSSSFIALIMLLSSALFSSAVTIYYHTEPCKFLARICNFLKKSKKFFEICVFGAFRGENGSFLRIFS